METVIKSTIQQKNGIEKSNSERTSKKINILMVDDHLENLLALEAVLSSSQYHLVGVNSGEEALKYILREDFALILLDVQMPGLNGFETAKLIRSRERSKHIPILFITAISQDMDHVLRGYSVGAIDYIFKPFHPETLKRKVEQFVNIYKNHEKKISKTETKHTVELEKVNKKLNRTNSSLRKMEALTKASSEVLFDTIVTFDGDGTIAAVNPAVKAMFGYKEEELIGESIISLFSEISGEKESRTVLLENSFKKSLIGKVIEATAIRKNSSIFPCDLQIGEAIIEEEPIFVCSIRDVTERKKIEELKNQQVNDLERLVKERTAELILANEKLKKEIEERKKMSDFLALSEERFRKIFESSPNLLAIRSKVDGKYFDVNSTWENEIGYSVDELNGHSNELLYYAADSSDKEKIKRKSVKIDDVLRNEKVSFETKSGEVHQGLLSTEVIDIQSEPCILIVLTDITERTHLEKEMSRLDRLNLIGEMAAGIAHEIRNPMTTVCGFLQMSKNNREILTAEHIDLMMKELGRANAIITEFLNLAKNKVSDQSKQQLNPIIESLFPLIQAEAMLSDKHVLLQLDKCPELYLDEKEIRQLVLNLSLNGLDAMQSGGILTIRTYCEQSAVILEIIDTGSGIKQDIIEKIGTPFFTTKDEGTGLGLAICYSVAERHQAEISIDTSSEGTTFKIRFTN
ncbi:PAS domain S-box protein [Bacillus taeanensis]|uniref:histidine kinase n=1 Tax=Bacillus taeanensis TaxID=273032 RepID=A0A366Y1S2_9BACI|nr:PAS domain S-box protein [Bacillus taeanensis]RBW70929.1 hybrid sensor histidine kinase/response regulator [Bacillus taeanensis]